MDPQTVVCIVKIQSLAPTCIPAQVTVVLMVELGQTPQLKVMM